MDSFEMRQVPVKDGECRRYRQNSDTRAKAAQVIGYLELFSSRDAHLRQDV